MYKNQKRGDKPLVFGFGADEGTRTHMKLLSLEPESSASANSATSANRFSPHQSGTSIIIAHFYKKSSRFFEKSLYPRTFLSVE